MYKIFIGKKKTGLPNPDYPPLIMDKKIKNSYFSVLSILYDIEHIDERHSNINFMKLKELKDKKDKKSKDPKEKDSNKSILKSSGNIFDNLNSAKLNNKENDLKENLIAEKNSNENKKANRGYNFDSNISQGTEYEIKRNKGCCPCRNRCLIL